MARRGEHHHCARLTEARVRAMRRLHYDRGIPINCIARLYGVRYDTVWDAVSYETWKHVKDG